jgi:hypothetical protein
VQDEEQDGDGDSSARRNAHDAFIAGDGSSDVGEAALVHRLVLESCPYQTRARALS